MLKINEIFHSIQGESSYAGRPCIFIRLTYCNLRCSYCDTTDAFYEGNYFSIDDILKVIHSYQCKLVEITGGEPLLQSDVYPLMNRLCDEGYEVLLETNGSVDISNVDPRVKKIIDIKCPTSGMANKNLWENINHVKYDDEIKFVISNREDYDWMKDVILRYQISDRCKILTGPVYNVLNPAQLAEWILNDNLDVRMQLQLQKYIWSPETRGV